MGETNEGEPESQRSASEANREGGAEIDDAIVLAGSFLVLLLALGFLNGVLTGGEEWFTNQIIAIALLPPVIYLFATGNISSLELPGLKIDAADVLRDVSLREIPPQSRGEGERESLEAEEENSRIESIVTGFTELEGDDMISIVLGDTFTTETIETKLEHHPDAEYVIYTDESNRVAGLSPVRVAQELPDFEMRVTNQSILEEPDVSTSIVHEGDPTDKAIQMLEQEHADVLLVVDDAESLVGLVAQEGNETDRPRGEIEEVDRHEWSDSVSVVLGGNYPPGTIQAELTQMPETKYVVYTDSTNRVRGLSPVTVAKAVPDFEARVSNESILDVPNVSTRLVYEDDTAREMLKKLDRERADVLAVVDEGERLRGVVTRDDVLTKLILTEVDRQR